MRIAYLVHQYPPDHVGGTEVYTHGLARRAAVAGHDVLVLTYRESPSASARDHREVAREHEGVPVVEFPYNLAIAPSRARYEYDNPFVGARVHRVLTEFAPDVAHVTHAMKLTVSAIDACRSLGVPTVLSLCDYWFLCARHTLLTWDERLCDGPSDWRECLRCLRHLHGVKSRRSEREAVRARAAHTRAAVESADRIFALSSFLRGMFVANGYDPARIEVLPHGLESEGLRPPARRRPGPIRFAFVGSLQPFKGAHVAVEALVGDPSLDAELRIHGAAGPPEYAELLRRLAGDDRRISFPGRFEPADFARVVGDADYVLIPALWYENEPIIVKAAKHMGIPVLASRLGTLAEMIEEGIEGWTVPPGDVTAWRGAMRRAALDRDGVPRLPSPQASMDDHFRDLEHVYEELSMARSAGRA